MSQWSLPGIPAQIHFVGIGGIGMSGLARMMRERGYDVSGSDAARFPLQPDLETIGVTIAIGHDADGPVSRADLVVRTAAVPLGNPEIATATAAGVPVLKRSEFLGAISRGSRCLAVAGSHGKSTTSAMVASALLELGANPTYAIGAVLQSTGSNAGNGDGAHFVVEADEFDRSFLTLSPTHAVITNVEFDHPDIFASQADYDDAFAEFSNLVAPQGSLIASHDDPGTQRVLERLDSGVRQRVVTVGASSDADWRVVDKGSGFVLESPSGDVVEMTLGVPGWHNIMNASMAVALLAQEGFSVGETAKAVESFRGIGRRFEIKGEVGGILVIDDYAHHPTEIEATLAAARDRYRDRRIWAVFQPHTYSRTAALVDEFSAALTAADEVLLMDVFASRESDDGSVTEDDLRRIAGESGHRSIVVEDTARTLAQLLRPGDVVLTMGAGDVTNLGPLLLQILNQPGSLESG